MSVTASISVSVKGFPVSAALLAEDRVFLVCDGLDTLATVSLNGQELGKTDNMSRRYEWEVKSLLRAGENQIVVDFDSPIRYCAEQQAKRPMHSVSAAIAGGTTRGVAASSSVHSSTTPSRKMTKASVASSDVTGPCHSD